MSLPENISLNNITDLLKEIAQKHNMLKGFEVGEEASRGYSDKEKKELEYPYLWVEKNLLLPLIVQWIAVKKYFF